MHCTICNRRKSCAIVAVLMSIKNVIKIIVSFLARGWCVVEEALIISYIVEDTFVEKPSSFLLRNSISSLKVVTSTGRNLRP